MFLLLVHWVGCIWYMIAMDNAYICIDEGREKYCTAYLHDSWIVANGWDRGVQDLDLMIISWYWASTTITSVGYGDILPGNRTEYVFATIIEIVGSLLVAVLFGSMSLIAANLYQDQDRFDEKMYAIKQLCVNGKVPPKVMGKVFDFYQYQFLRRRDFGKNVIEDLPSSLHGEVIGCIEEELMKKTVFVSFFYDPSSDGLLVDIAILLEPQFHVPRDILYQAGEYCDAESRQNGTPEDWGATTIYFIKSGQVQMQDKTSAFLLCELNNITDKDQSNVDEESNKANNKANEKGTGKSGRARDAYNWETLLGGDYFGDNYFVSDVPEDTRWQRHSTAVSLSYSQFSTITDTLELEAVLHRHGTCHEAVCAIATARFYVSCLPAAEEGNTGSTGNTGSNGSNVGDAAEVKNADGGGGGVKGEMQMSYLQAFKDTSRDETGYSLSGSDLYEYNDRAMAHHVADTIFDIAQKAKEKRGHIGSSARPSSLRRGPSGSVSASGAKGRGVTLSRSGSVDADPFGRTAEEEDEEEEDKTAEEDEDEADHVGDRSFVFPVADDPHMKTNKKLLTQRSTLISTLALGGRGNGLFGVDADTRMDMGPRMTSAARDSARPSTPVTRGHRLESGHGTATEVTATIGAKSFRLDEEIRANVATGGGDLNDVYAGQIELTRNPSRKLRNRSSLMGAVGTLLGEDMKMEGVTMGVDGDEEVFTIGNPMGSRRCEEI